MTVVPPSDDQDLGLGPLRIDRRNAPDRVDEVGRVVLNQDVQDDRSFRGDLRGHGQQQRGGHELDVDLGGRRVDDRDPNALLDLGLLVVLGGDLRATRGSDPGRSVSSAFSAMSRVKESTTLPKPSESALVLAGTGFAGAQVQTVADRGVVGKARPVEVPWAASAAAVKPHCTPMSRLKLRDVSTMRASIITCGVSASSVVISSSSGSILLRNVADDQRVGPLVDDHLAALGEDAALADDAAGRPRPWRRTACG